MIINRFINKPGSPEDFLTDVEIVKPLLHVNNFYFWIQYKYINGKTIHLNMDTFCYFILLFGDIDNYGNYI